MARVYKFGGASVKDANGVRNVEQIVRQADLQAGLMVVVSAMGKTTNALERVVEFLDAGKEEQALAQWVDIIDFHVAIMKELGLQPGTDIRLQGEIPFDPTLPFDENYDQVVSLGEIMSTQIVAVYLLKQGLSVEWWNMPKLLRTDDTWREAKVEDQIQPSEYRSNAGIHRRYRGRQKDNARTGRIRLHGGALGQLPRCRIGHDLERCAGYPQCRPAHRTGHHSDTLLTLPGCRRT